MELIARVVIKEIEGDNVSLELLQEYADPDSEKHAMMVEGIRQKLNFTSLRFNRLDDMLDSVGIDPNSMCTYCWDGRE
jgi:amidophosphoribosyltransferase